jgi:4-amino-4-deoxy-L-arabinose transferase-like glycosyltransferase
MLARTLSSGKNLFTYASAKARALSPTPQTDMAWVVAFTVLIFFLRVIYLLTITPYGLGPDEAQYWTWLVHNDWSFLTKPPLTTWALAVSTYLFGDTLMGVKFFALVGQGMVALLGHRIAFFVAEPKVRRTAGWLGWLTLTTVPLMAGGGLMMSPDALLVPLWLLATYMVVRALRDGVDDTHALCSSRWVLLGVVVGLAGLAKYSAMAFYPLLLVWMAVWRPAWLKNRWLWVGMALAALMQAPVVYWNVLHHGEGVNHVLWQASGGSDGRHAGLQSFGEFLASQLLVLGPITFFFVAAVLWRGWQKLKYPRRWAKLAAPHALLLVLSLPIVGGFMLLSLTAKVQANWPVLGTVTALVLMAAWVARYAMRPKRSWVLKTVVAGLLLNTFLSVVLLDTHKFHEWGLFPVPLKNDPTKDLRGWPQMGPVLHDLFMKLDHPVVLASRYQTLAPLAFHTEPNARNGLEIAYMNAENRRLNQYDLWPKPNLTDRLVVYVNERNMLPDGIRTSFKGCQKWKNIEVNDADTLTRRVTLYLCWGWQHPTETPAVADAATPVTPTVVPVKPEDN